MASKLIFHHCIRAIFLILLAACGQQTTSVTPTVVVADTALSMAFTEFAQTPTAMPTFIHITPPTFSPPDLSLPPTPSFFTRTPGPSPTVIPMNSPLSVTPAPTRTPLPFVPLEGLRVADETGGNLYVQDSGKEAIQLTDSGQDSHPLLSEDGQIIAFYRGRDQLYMIRSDGTGEQELISHEVLSAFGEVYENEFFGLSDLAFLPGSHQLIFNTQTYHGMDDALPVRNNDLWFVDAGTGELRQLRTPGQGGNFLPAPNGKWIAVQAVNRIDVIDAQGQTVRRDLIMYPANDAHAWVPMSWTPDSKELIMLPSNIDPLTGGIPVLREIWRYSLEGGSRIQVPLKPSPLGDMFSISPDGNRIVYGYHPSELDPDATIGVYLGSLRDGTSHVIFEPPLNEAGYQDLPFSYDAWSPDNIHFIFSDYDRIFLGNIRGEIVNLGRGKGILGWVDNNRYLFKGGEVIGKVGTKERVNVMGSFPFYEFADPVSFVFLGH